LLAVHSVVGGACWNELPLTTVAVLAEGVLHANRGGVFGYHALGAFGVYVLLTNRSPLQSKLAVVTHWMPYQLQAALSRNVELRTVTLSMSP
jgi:hypothetical protein